MTVRLFGFFFPILTVFFYFWTILMTFQMYAGFASSRKGLLSRRIWKITDQKCCHSWSIFIAVFFFCYLYISFCVFTIVHLPFESFLQALVDVFDVPQDELKMVERRTMNLKPGKPMQVWFYNSFNSCSTPLCFIVIILLSHNCTKKRMDNITLYTEKAIRFTSYVYKYQY